ncbi:hypothetical protein LCGC14_0647480 [marine sediment metagenome]|uniref:Uroporphyrinogen decarboxylase (URO-D) domain-containing protein n=1 Tax=marine sediment metagenome TaxID=412755 RepID=A0A0F9TJ21_9ZZZZ|nr:hypothetical protein [Phycisphaerae bacterium]HDZ43970.1 hypothetical protein [Phycisphaerae bacterium]
MALPKQDREVLRRLVGELAEIAALPVHTEKAELWRRLNRLEPVRPLVWINEIPWGEINVNDELTQQCNDPVARSLEWRLLTELYQWRHFPGDMVVSDFLVSQKIFYSTHMGLGIHTDGEIDQGDGGIVSRHYQAQHFDFDDVERLQPPGVTYDAATTELNYRKMCDAVGDIMPVKLLGTRSHWYAPWDYLVQAWGIQEAMVDLVDRPELITAFISRLVDCNVAYLDRLEELNLLACNNDNTRVGAGGYGCTDELPGERFDPDHVRLHNQWGCATAQIFSVVSPEMHWQFALRHEMRILERFGLTYYGCCEPLDIKMGILRKVPNLRKVSMSPWVVPERGAAELGRDYVYSHKPNPAILAEDTWRPAQARAELRDVLEKTRGCNVEIILKDISTVRHQPQRLWEWSQIATEEAERIGE